MPVDINAVARVVGIETQFRDFRAGRIVYLPQRVAVFAQGNDAATYATTKYTITSAAEAGRRFGFGSPAHLAARQLLPVNGDGVGTVPVTIYPLSTPAAGAASAGAITPSAAATANGSIRVWIGGIQTAPITITSALTVADQCTAIAAAINGLVEMPVTATATATAVNLAAKWSGAAGDDIKIEITESAPLGVDYAITAMASGAGIPDVAPALAQVGEVWETFILNTVQLSDTATLDLFEAWGEPRWGALTRKPAVVLTGTTLADVSSATAISAARRLDRVNSQVAAPGSPELPFVIAARALARIANSAQNNPPRDYARQTLSGLRAGTSGQQWDYVQRDQALKLGSSTTELKNDVLSLSDVVTFYRPEGEEDPAYRYVVDIVKLQNIIFNVDLRFNSEGWDGAPLIPNDQPTVNPTAKRPKDAVAEMYAVVDNLALEAIISDPAFTKANTVATINSQNPKRLDLDTSIKLSGNANVISVGLFFGFYFGG